MGNRLGRVIKITEVAQTFWDTFFPNIDYELILTKYALGDILGDFFTSKSGHPVDTFQNNNSVTMAVTPPTTVDEYKLPFEKEIASPTLEEMQVTTSRRVWKRPAAKTRFSWSQSYDRDLQHQRCKFLQRHG
jgi:hypothetical protein